jgi:hypothetical protein
LVTEEKETGSGHILYGSEKHKADPRRLIGENLACPLSDKGGI